MIDELVLTSTFDGTAQPGTEAALVADKISEIENRPISEAEKAAKMEEVMQAVAGTTGTAEVIAEAERFRDIHEERATAEAAESEGNGAFGPEIIDKILGIPDPAKQAELDRAAEIGTKLGVNVVFDETLNVDGRHFSDGTIVINPIP